MFVSICPKKHQEEISSSVTWLSGENLAAWQGVVLLEAAAFWPWCKFLGLELDQQQLALRLRKDLDTAGLDGFAIPY